MVLWGLLNLINLQYIRPLAHTSNCFCVQLVNNGPSVVSHSTLEVRCPLRGYGHELLYPVEVDTEGLLSCSSKHTFNALKLKVRTHTGTNTWQQLCWIGEPILVYS